MLYSDLRDFLSHVDDMGELKTIGNLHWDKEMGAVTEMVYREKPTDSPALLFNNIAGYTEKYQCLYGMLASVKRFGLAMGLDVSGNATIWICCRPIRGRAMSGSWRTASSGW